MLPPAQNAARPILFVDIDGVISLLGHSPYSGVPPGVFYWVEGVAHCISHTAGACLARLAHDFDLVWASGWEQLANRYLPELLGLPFDRLPCLDFRGRATWGSSHWKLDAIEEYAAGRPLAWVDDNLAPECGLWAVNRGAPTLLVPTDPMVGLTGEHVDELLTWAAVAEPARDTRAA